MATYAEPELFKSSLNITKDDRDEELEAALEDASRGIDGATGRRDDGFTLAADATARTYEVAGRIVQMRNGRTKLLIDEIGAVAGLIVQTGDGTTWTAATGFRTAPGNALADAKPIDALTVLGGWGIDLVQVTARWGWPAVPKNIRRATLILATRLYRRPSSPEGVAGGGSDFGAVRLAQEDPDVRKLIQPYTLAGIG